MRTRRAVIGCVLGVALAAPSVRAEGFLWATRMGGTSPGGAYGVTDDDNGSVNTTVFFVGTTDSRV